MISWVKEEYRKYPKFWGDVYFEYSEFSISDINEEYTNYPKFKEDVYFKYSRFLISDIFQVYVKYLTLKIRNYELRIPEVNICVLFK